MVESAGGAVELAIGLVGVMALFLGLMKVAEEGGMLTILARLIRPLMVRLFPDVPPDHPAMGAMILNLSANALGLGNAATPFGIRAMQELDRLNPQKGTASDSMALFLAINTSSVTLLPTGVIALRASAGSADPAAILPTKAYGWFPSPDYGRAFGRLLRSEYPFVVIVGRHFTPEPVRGDDTHVGIGCSKARSRLGLRCSRFRRFLLTTLQPCLHSSFTVTACLADRRLRLVAYRLSALALRHLITIRLP